MYEEEAVLKDTIEMRKKDRLFWLREVFEKMREPAPYQGQQWPPATTPKGWGKS